MTGTSCAVLRESAAAARACGRASGQTLNQRVPGSSPGAPTIDPIKLFALLHQTITEQFDVRFESFVRRLFTAAWSFPPFELGDGAVAERRVAGEIMGVED
jgi:hypothetical protein